MRKAKPGFRKRIALNLYAKHIDIQAKIHELKYLFWECTLRCNLNCRHCGSDCHKDVAIQDMPAQDFLNITSQVSKECNPAKVMIVITGGEPLMRKDLEDVGGELTKQGFPWGFVTNGVALNKQRFEKCMQNGLTSITVSLDGMKESHNWLRGSNTFQKASDAIKMIAKEKLLTSDVVSCITQKNINELEEIKEYILSLGMKRWRIFTIDPIGRAKDDKDLNLEPKQLKQVLDFVVKTRKENKIQLSFGCDAYLGAYENEIRDGFFFCKAGINVASVLVDGSISACPNNSREVIQGNIYQDNFIEIWNNKYQIMRDRTWSKTGICANCDSFKWCRGSGLHLWDFEKNEVAKCQYEELKKAFD